MIDFLLGTLAGAFLMLALLQLATNKTINLAGITDKAEDSKRYWNFVLAYFTGCLGIVVLFLFYDKL